MVTLLGHSVAPIRLAHRADRTVPDANAPVAQSAYALAVTGTPVQPPQELGHQLAELLLLTVVEALQGLSQHVTPGGEETVCRLGAQAGELDAHPPSPAGLSA